MMSEQQFETVLAAVADLQVAVDALGLDVQHALEILAAADSPQPPEWVKGDDGPVGDAADETDGPPEGTVPSVAYPPPARARVGAAAGYVVIAAFGAAVAALLVVFFLLGT